MDLDLLAIGLFLLCIWIIRKYDDQLSAHPNKKPIETNRLILRCWADEDASDLYEYAQSKLVGPRAGWLPHKSIEESREVIQHFVKEEDVYAITLKTTGKVIGSIGIHDKSPDETIKHKKQREVGYVLNPDFWGQGYMPEAVEAVKRHCFETLKVDILWCGHFVGNSQSKRVIEKTGFAYQFTKDTILPKMDNQVVKTMFYKLER